MVFGQAKQGETQCKQEENKPGCLLLCVTSTRDAEAVAAVPGAAEAAAWHSTRHTTVCAASADIPKIGAEAPGRVAFDRLRGRSSAVSRGPNGKLSVRLIQHGHCTNPNHPAAHVSDDVWFMTLAGPSLDSDACTTLETGIPDRSA